MKSLRTRIGQTSKLKKKISKQFVSFYQNCEKSEAVAVELLKNSNILEELIENVNQKEII